MRLHRSNFLLAAVALVAAAACSAGDAPRTQRPQPLAASSRPAGAGAEPSPGQGRPLPAGVSERPRWLGKRILPQRPDGLGIARSTPPLLRNRRLATVDVLPPPEGRGFVSSVRRAPRRVLRRSTWRPYCPVAADDLSYVTTSFWGFDGRPHSGELLVHRSVARDIVSVFRKLYRARWPIEEMRITRMRELNAPPTGDGNNTGAFVCRPARLSSEWSEHAYGVAVDVNPFHNPYVRDGLVLPERALAYGNRSWRRPGMIFPGDVVTRAFARIGWGWGGEWSSAKDWMHFSRSGS